MPRGRKKKSLEEASGPEKPKITRYLDYRQYLEDYFAWRKEEEHSFSLRSFAGRLSPSLSESAASSLLSAILKRRRNISTAFRPKMARCLGLREKEAEYFDSLVQFNQAKGMEEKNQHFLQLSRFRNSRAKEVSETQYKFFSNWYYPVVWNFLGMDQGSQEPAEIARSLFPPITESQVQDAIRLLLTLQLIRKKAGGGYEVVEPHLSAEREFQGLMARQYNQRFIRMAVDMLDHVPPERRQYNTLVFSLSEEGYGAIKERMEALQEEMRAIIDRDRDTDRVYAFSMQFFPFTKSN